MVENISIASESSWCSRHVPALILLITTLTIAFTTSASALTLQSTKRATVMPPELSFSIHPALFHSSTTVEVAKIWLVTDDLQRMPIWIAEKTDQRGKEPAKTVWADSQSCPQLLPTLASLSSLEPITLTLPGAPPKPANIMLDGENYEVNVTGVYSAEHARAETQLSGNDDTPIAKWVDGVLASLKSCWRSTPPI